MKNSVRVFIAVDISEKMRSFILEIEKKLRRYPLNVRYLPPENIHLTLKFIGDVSISVIDRIVFKMDEISKEFSPLYLEIKGMGVFPSFKHPKVLWLGLSGGISLLKSIQKRLEEKMEKVGFPKDGKPFKAHLTLGRMKEGIDSKLLRDMMENEGNYDAFPFEASSITLYKSQLQPDRAYYTPLKKIQLSGNCRRSQLTG